MTTLQLRVAAAVQELGSISAAAAKLNISQPNASNCLKLLETEIGFPIFERSKAGALLTEKGHRFLSHAKRILDEQDSIMGLRTQGDKYRLRLGTVVYSLALEPFLTLCEEHCKDFECDLCYSNVTVEEGIRELSDFRLDIFVVPVLKSQIAGLKSSCQKYGLSLLSAGLLQTSMNLRKGHPAILDGRCNQITQGCHLMKEFPYVAYRNPGTAEGSPTKYNDSDFVESKYKIYVDGMEARLQLISRTDAFSFAIMPKKSTMDKYGIAAFPIPEITAEVFCIVRESDSERKDMAEFISLLKKEIESRGE